MKGQPRRNFIKSCLYAAVSGLSLGVFTLCSGFGKKRIQGSQNKILASNGRNRNDPIFEPSYLELHRTGELQKRGEALWRIME
ncbi:MAG: hypothetical protein KAR19_14510, partial [Bacteroidales bacterium]|nr:hypothetical protein [Bacteroidales bacterium]